MTRISRYTRWRHPRASVQPRCPARWPSTSTVWRYSPTPCLTAQTISACTAVLTRTEPSLPLQSPIYANGHLYNFFLKLFPSRLFSTASR